MVQYAELRTRVFICIVSCTSALLLTLLSLLLVGSYEVTQTIFFALFILSVVATYMLLRLPATRY